MGYFDWNDNGRLDNIDTAIEIKMLEEIQRNEAANFDGAVCYNFMAAAAVIGGFLSILSFLG